LSEFFDRRAKVTMITFGVFCALLIGMSLWGMSCMASLRPLGQ
jgi:hypothetical protein